MIVDAQVHLWKANTPDRPWLPDRVAQLPEPFLIEKLVPMMDEAGVDRAVIVPPSWEGDRNDYALEAVRRYPARFAVMGRIPLERSEYGKAPAGLEEAAGHARHQADVSSAAMALAHRRHRGLVLAAGGEVQSSDHVLRRADAELRARRRAVPAD